jgi:hypothetical protein
MKPKSPRDPIAAFERETRAARRVGEGARCNKCGEDRPLALIPGSKPTVCANCQREKLGKSLFDNHHPAGQANHPATTRIPVNDHRAVLSPAQYEWPPETWENPAGSPLRKDAACLRGYCETNDYLVATLLLPRAEMLEALDAFLEKRLGPRWWDGTDMECFAPKRKSNQVATNAKVPGDFRCERFRDSAPLAEHIKAGCRKYERSKR